MNSMKIAFIVLVIGSALMALRREPAAKVQGRMEAIDQVEARLADLRSFCAVYYAWRDAPDRIGGGLAEIDRLCFDAQEMKP